MSDIWDEVIVGAGSAGAVLAGRLSEEPDRRVLLLEAGAAHVPPADRPAVLGTPVLSGSNWDYDAQVGSDPGGRRRVPYSVGKVVGGSSAINGAMAMRALPYDFDCWAAAGNPDWSWERVVPFYAGLESDADYTGDGHGSDGPVPIQRPRPAAFNAMAVAFQRACRGLDLPDLPDLNGGGSVGVGPVPTNSSSGRIMSSADTHLAQALRRPNLDLWCRTTAVRVVVERGRAVGVEVLRDGRPEVVRARQITLSAGAVNTPVLLQRSGIGDARRSEQLGIRAAADLPGVGENLTDHPAIAMWALPKDGACEEGQPWHSSLARAARNGGPPEANLFLVNNVTAGAMSGAAGVPEIGGILAGRMAIAVFALLLRPASRGSVRITGAAPDARPVITLNLTSAPQDVEALMWATRLAWSVLRSSPVAELLQRVLVWTDRMVADDTLLRTAITRFVTPTWHATGTARMGPAADRLAVVDQRCRVHGISGLRVADASVMPCISSAPTNLTCMMLAERVAAWAR